MSLVSDVRGIGAEMTVRPCRCNGRMTLFQQEPSAHAPCIRMIAESFGKAFISNPYLLWSGAECHSHQETLSSQRQCRRRVSPSQSARYPETRPVRSAGLSGRPPRLRGQKRGRSYPKSQAKVASSCGNLPESLSRASRWTRSPEINQAESLCSLAAPSVPCPTCRTPAQHCPKSPHRACTASAFPPVSEYCSGLRRGVLRWAQPNSSGSDPRHHQGLLHRHFRSVKRLLGLVPGEPLPGGSLLAHHSRTHRVRSSEC